MIETTSKEQVLNDIKDIFFDLFRERGWDRGSVGIDFDFSSDSCNVKLHHVSKRKERGKVVVVKVTENL